MHEILECKLERLDFTVIQWFQHIHSKLSFYLQFMQEQCLFVDHVSLLLTLPCAHGFSTLIYQVTGHPPCYYGLETNTYDTLFSES